MKGLASTMKNGYKEAEKVDKIINKFLKDDPPSPDNVQAWATFLRTIQTTIEILQATLHSSKQS